MSGPSADHDMLLFPEKGDRAGSREVTVADRHGVAWRDLETGHTGRFGRDDWRDWVKKHPERG